jgi:hypothetical protein
MNTLKSFAAEDIPEVVELEETEATQIDWREKNAVTPVKD